MTGDGRPDVTDGDQSRSTRRYHVGVTAVPYSVESGADRETVDCSMDRRMRLTVRAPRDTTVDAVESTLDDRRAWLLDTLYGLADARDPRLDCAFENGEKLLYAGEHHHLRVSESSVDEPTVQFDGTRFGLRVPRDGETSARDRRRAIVDWYREHAADVLPACVDQVGGDRPRPPISVVDDGRRWTRVDGGIALHWRLVLAPRPVAAYVAAHALVRARTNHDPEEGAFWDAVEAMVPGCRSRRAWLRHNGARLRL